MSGWDRGGKDMSEERWEEGAQDWPELDLTGVKPKRQGSTRPRASVDHGCREDCGPVRPSGWTCSPCLVDLEDSEAGVTDSLGPVGQDSCRAAGRSSTTVLTTCDGCGSLDGSTTSLPSCSGADCDNQCGLCPETKKEHTRNCRAKSCCYGAIDPGSFHFANGMKRTLVDAPWLREGTICCSTMEEINRFRETQECFQAIYYPFYQPQPNFSQVEPIHIKDPKSKKHTEWKKCLYLIGAERHSWFWGTNDTCKNPREVKDLFSGCYGYYFDKRDNKTEENYRGKFADYQSIGWQETPSLADAKRFYQIYINHRAYFVTSLHYSPCVNQFLFSRLIFEAHPTGYLVPTPIFYPLKMFWYVDKWDFIVLGAQILAALLILWYLAQLVRELVYFGWCFFRLPWCLFLLALVTAGLTWFTLFLWTYFETLSSLGPTLETCYKDPLSYPNVGFLVKLHDMLSKSLAMFSFLVVLMTLKHLQLFRSFYIMSLAISIAFWKLVLSMASLMIITLAFSLFAFITFGRQVEQFSTVSSSFFSVYVMILGGHRGRLMRNVEPHIATFFLLLFVVVIILVWIKFFLVVLLDAYGEAKCSDCLTGRRFVGDYFEGSFGKNKWRDSCCEEEGEERTEQSYACAAHLGGGQSEEDRGAQLHFVNSKFDHLDETCGHLKDKLDTLTEILRRRAAAEGAGPPTPLVDPEK